MSQTGWKEGNRAVEVIMRQGIQSVELEEGIFKRHQSLIEDKKSKGRKKSKVEDMNRVE